MEKNDFKQDTRYTVTLRDGQGRLHPANIYVYRLYNDFMIVRMTERDGLLRKLAYSDVEKIVRTRPVATQDRFFIPEAVLAEKVWKDRDHMFRYSSSPHMGK